MTPVLGKSLKKLDARAIKDQLNARMIAARNNLGKTDMVISPISLGSSALTGIYGSYDFEKSVRFVQDCLFLGVKYIDTSPWYGYGSSENIIGKALKGVNRQEYFIGTKVGRYGTNPFRMFDFSADRTLLSVEESLSRLGIAYLDLVQVHDISFGNLDQILYETLPALQRMVDEGKVRYIGVADYDLDLLKCVVEESEIKIDTILSYAKSTLFDNRLQKYAGLFKSRGVGIINAAPTGMGLLSNRGPQPWHPASPEIITICNSAAKMCQERKLELDTIARWYSIQQPKLDTTVCGLRDIYQLINTLRVIKNGLTNEQQHALMDLKKHYFNRGTMHWDQIDVQDKAGNITSQTSGGIVITRSRVFQPCDFAFESNLSSEDAAGDAAGSDISMSSGGNVFTSSAVNST